MDLTAYLLETLPDIPRWVELRSELLAGSAVVLGAPGGLVVRGAEGVGQLLYVVGAPSRALLAEAALAAPEAELLVTPEDHGHVAALLGARGTRAELFLLPDEERLPEPAGVELLGAGDAERLAPVPEPLRGELLSALEEGPLAVAFVDGQPASFCYAGAVSEALWDISIDTLEPYRRRGLAGRAVTAMVRHMRGRGSAPVWGAAEDNPASSLLAKRLGFTPVDHLFLFPAEALAERA